MKYKVGLITLFLVFSITVVYAGPLENSAYDNSSVKEKGKVVNTVCPVMGGKVAADTKYKVEYQGQTIGFCCPACIAAFNEDPEKYVEKINQ